MRNIVIVLEVKEFSVCQCLNVLLGIILFSPMSPSAQLSVGWLDGWSFSRSVSRSICQNLKGQGCYASMHLFEHLLHSKFHVHLL